MVQPRQRGAFLQSEFIPSTVDDDAPRDYYALFPAGVKNSSTLTGMQSQQVAAGARGWTPYDPYDPKFIWRAGVCGDAVWRTQDHLKGGEFYYNATIVSRYRQGGTVGIATVITAHHNGFMELHLCDAAKCPNGDISRSCFTSGACMQLNRAPNAECDSGKSYKCGPIDRNYPGRWYVPCSHDIMSGYDYYPPQYAQFQLPLDWHCKHCVLQWYWVSANDCNPPGVLDYFDGPDRPSWGTCVGQGDAIGGVARRKAPCGGPERMTEEYYQCADIAIEPYNSGGRSAPPPKATAKVTKLSYGRRKARNGELGTGVFQQLLLWADKIPSRTMRNGSVIDISVYSRIAIEAVVNKPVSKVDFYLQGKRVYTGRNAPYFLYRDSSEVPFYWDNKTVNSEITVGAEAAGESIQVTVMLKQ
ncbi:hypothetical protein BWQ96_05336 [Gracilariopsis chorda]|uniref:Chitin-binding type-4 domain-containing protein n=1 Tax=Gracilariopsis chorda TaxID=448386 RepID=A0A2V3IS24_9FLOR|nr:hypothetical protein BWQ96_05336 [Gracilariopsis chorda]|eukprot:PXF44916.1 hypothetical protein BWQ96_05336 [Gracilariopsis chorda]